jgi:hypothetical protein
MTTRLMIGNEATRIELPVIPRKERGKPSFKAPEIREERGDARDLGGGAWPIGFFEWRRDLSRGTVGVEWKGTSTWEIKGCRYHATEKNYYETEEKDPARSRFSGEDSDRIELPGRTIYLLTNVEIRSDEKSFHVTFARQIFENDKLIRRREWKETVPRMFN